ncbi:hypothetical protein VTJ49DRAFT_3894 [Mycothermus thermophilus]|uniref:LSO1/LSO2 domain-containing protein n=1 Tax=Humicola insolens TaxID=85995 RepID=A0ABR3VM01_HUMIN
MARRVTQPHSTFALPSHHEPNFPDLLSLASIFLSLRRYIRTVTTPCRTSVAATRAPQPLSAANVRTCTGTKVTRDPDLQPGEFTYSTRVKARADPEKKASQKRSQATQATMAKKGGGEVNSKKAAGQARKAEAAARKAAEAEAAREAAEAVEWTKGAKSNAKK